MNIIEAIKAAKENNLGIRRTSWAAKACICYSPVNGYFYEWDGVPLSAVSHTMAYEFSYYEMIADNWETAVFSSWDGDPTGFH